MKMKGILGPEGGDARPTRQGVHRAKIFADQGFTVQVSLGLCPEEGGWEGKESEGSAGVSVLHMLDACLV